MSWEASVLGSGPFPGLWKAGVPARNFFIVTGIYNWEGPLIMVLDSSFYRQAEAQI